MDTYHQACRHARTVTVHGCRWLNSFRRIAGRFASGRRRTGTDRYAAVLLPLSERSAVSSTFPKT
ncbi:hypothetical protein DFR68_106485 [Nocardia mexicana]|uniref:Uncharacterized protein n=1 Tax=Nocardia mexicana TaxID=279262 RepID=A0A370H2K1_9NOCA|nr:hypothetical protein DFR68_106485 [Nocardia mexicana]